MTADAGSTDEKRNDTGPIGFSVVIVTYNAARHILDLLSDVTAQDYPPVDYEIIVVDGNSTDGTPNIASRHLEAHSRSAWRLLTNSGRTLPCGWNIAIRASKFPFTLRLDAHSRIPDGFLRACAEALQAGHLIAGGVVSTNPDAQIGRLARIAELSRFGGSAAAFRRPAGPGEVDTLAYAAYHRSVFAAVGLFDERLTRNQDNEMHQRLRQSGYRFHLDPRVTSLYKMRSTYRAILRHKYGNGFWGPLASSINFRCMALRHLAPFALLCAVLLTVGVALAAGIWLPLAALLSAYVIAAWMAGFSDFRSGRLTGQEAVLTPVATLPVHVAYGLGTFAGLVHAPYFRIINRHYQVRTLGNTTIGSGAHSNGKNRT